MRAIEREPELYFAPEPFVAGDVVGIAIADPIDRGPGAKQRVVRQNGRRRQSDPRCLPKEPSPGRAVVAHGSEYKTVRWRKHSGRS